MSYDLCQRVILFLSKTRLKTTIVDNQKAQVVEMVSTVPINIGTITTETFSLVVQNSPSHLIVDRLAMKRVRASLYYDKNVTTFRYKENVLRISMVTDGKEKTFGSDDGFTTSVSESEESKRKKKSQEESLDNKVSERKLVLVLNEI